LKVVALGNITRVLLYPRNEAFLKAINAGRPPEVRRNYGLGFRV
jgi:hypothetical protein